MTEMGVDTVTPGDAHQQSNFSIIVHNLLLINVYFLQCLQIVYFDFILC
jgi:hypothetical protein